MKADFYSGLYDSFVTADQSLVVELPQRINTISTRIRLH